MPNIVNIKPKPEWVLATSKNLVTFLETHKGNTAEDSSEGKVLEGIIETIQALEKGDPVRQRFFDRWNSWAAENGGGPKAFAAALAIEKKGGNSPLRLLGLDDSSRALLLSIFEQAGFLTE